jgi:molybdopterin converting factor subunit 1
VSRKVDLLYFAWVRERIGIDAERLDLPEGVADVAGLLDWLEGLDEAHLAGLHERGRLRVAVNQSFARPDDPVRPGDEIAIFPPVTGG